MIPALLRERGPFRTYWAGQTISLLGDQITLIALPLVAVQLLRAGPSQMGYLTAAGWLPFLILALPAGAWVDRRGRRRGLMILADLGRAAVVASVPLAALLHLLTLAQLYLVALGAGILAVLFNVSYQTVFVSMVPRERYQEGQALVNGSRAISYIGGPALGGLLVQLLSGPITLLADAASFLASAFSLARINPVEPGVAPRERGQLLAGARFILGTPIMRSGLAATATINLFNFAFAALFILFAVRDLHVQPGALGLVLGGGAIGGLLGSLITVRVSRRLGVGPAFMLGCLVFPLPLILVAFAAGPSIIILALLFVVEFVSGLGVMILDITLSSIYAALVPDRLRSRVTGAYTVVNYGSRPIGALLGGALGTALSVRQAVLVSAIGATLGVLWLLPSPFPGLRDLPEPAL